jgi:hypothetical protein
VRRVDLRFATLLAATTVPPTAQNAVIDAIGFRGAEGLSPQASAVWPYDTYHDMRWLLVYHDRWAVFLLLFLGIVVQRGVFTAIVVALAWPDRRVPRPPLRALVQRNLTVALVTALIVLPYAALAVAATAVSLSWFLFASLGPMLLLAPFLQRAGVSAGWWKGLPSIELVGWASLDFVLITIGGALVWTTPGRWGLPVAFATGLVNGLLWQRTVRAAVCPSRVRLPRVPAAPVAVALALAVPVGAQVITAHSHDVRENFRPPFLTRPLSDRVPYAVIGVAGHNSAYDGGPTGDPRVERFSYAGLDERGRPRPYGADATHQSLETTATLLFYQAQALHRRTGRPVALIGNSEGSMASRLLLERFPDSPVKAVLMFSPLIRAGRGFYPPRQAATGWGLAAGWQLRLIFWTGNAIRPEGTDPDEPFLRSLMDNGPFYRFETMCPVPGVRMIAFLPTVSAAEAPPGDYTKIPVYQQPAFHGGLLSEPVVNDRIVEFLAGEPVAEPRAEYPVLQRLGAAWQAPGLAVTLNPVWRDQVDPGAPFGPRLCRPL